MVQCLVSDFEVFYSNNQRGSILKISIEDIPYEKYKDLADEYMDKVFGFTNKLDRDEWEKRVVEE